jgi:hypothetical protein
MQGRGYTSDQARPCKNYILLLGETMNIELGHVCLFSIFIWVCVWAFAGIKGVTLCIALVAFCVIFFLAVGVSKVNLK